MPKVPMLILALATLAYPLAVYLGFGRIEPFWLGLVLLALMLARAWAARDAVWLFAGGGAAVLALLGTLGNSWLPLKLYPVMVSAVLLAVFGASVLRPPTVVERIARLTDPLLPEAAVPYTRAVTLVWCAFFILNGAAALFTALWASNETWLFYNGLVAYLLMGGLFAAEWLVRQRVKARIAATSKENHA
ncbi:MAG TPA: hypothetical protein VLI46_02940 [Ramlibacter sp.]|nr:hypothetical protein [Ramlibacter sp.]